MHVTDAARAPDGARENGKFRLSEDHPSLRGEYPLDVAVIHPHRLRVEVRLPHYGAPLSEIEARCFLFPSGRASLVGYSSSAVTSTSPSGAAESSPFDSVSSSGVTRATTVSTSPS